MRIIGGKYRGRQIHPPRNFKSRPTTDFARESLFNILVHQFDLADLDVLDLFSGTGSISYEFASRGARIVVAVELDPVHLRFVERTCRELELDQVTVIRGDAFRFIRHPVQAFDIIFADPPYDHPGLGTLPDLVCSSPVLQEGGIFVLEHPRNLSFTAHPRYLQQRKYGGVNFSFFR